MANEPQAQRIANAMLIEYSFLIDEVSADPSTIDEERVDDEFVGVGIVCCRQIGAHREVFWSYGDHFPRRYTAGRTCRAPPRNAMENPRDILGRIPRDCVSLDVIDHWKLILVLLNYSKKGCLVHGPKNSKEISSPSCKGYTCSMPRHARISTSRINNLRVKLQQIKKGTEPFVITKE